MSRSIPVWLMATALAAFVGCGGGSATDSGAVAENSGSAAPASGGAAPASDGGAAMPSADSGMTSPSTSAMPGSPGSAEMNAYGAGGAAAPGADPSAGYAGGDTAAMAAAYASNEGANAGATAPGAYPGAGAEGAYPGGANPAGADGAYPGGANPAGADGAYPGGANPAGAEGAGAYPGGAYPGGPGGPGGGAVEEKVPDGFDGKAQQAFRRGKEKDAIQFLYAHALTNDAGAESLLPTIRWVGGLRQPKLAVRWGVGFIVTAPRNFNGDPKPVGSEQKLPTREGKKGGGNEGYVGGGGAGDYGGGQVGGGNSLLAKGAGELGEKLAAAYTLRLMQGDFGEVLKKAMEGKSGGNQGDSGGAGAAGYGAASGAMPMSGAVGGGEGGGGGAAAAATQVTQIMPGLSMLGIGTQKELIDRAREDDIDAVVILDVKLRVNPEGLVTNETTIMLLEAKTQKKFYTTKKFNNITIQKARAEDKEDGVDEELEKLFEAIDANLKMADLPDALNAELVTKRVASLTAEKHDNPLPALAEVQMYHTKGLLEENALFAAYEQLLSVDAGRLLATGTEEDKKKALEPWLPES
ncbi:MAG: hypothetical protein ABI614_08040 [Planctomycetota bacterium]